MLNGGLKTDFTTIPQQIVVSKTHELLTDQDIMQMFEERAIKKWNTIFLVNFEQYYTGKKEGKGFAHI